MTSWQEIEADLSGLICPSCGWGDLALILRCDLSYGECLHQLRCPACCHQMVLTAPDLALEEIIQAEAGSLPKLSCPRCGAPRPRLSLACGVDDHRCGLYETCPVCLWSGPLNSWGPGPGTPRHSH